MNVTQMWDLTRNSNKSRDHLKAMQNCTMSKRIFYKKPNNSVLCEFSTALIYWLFLYQISETWPLNQIIFGYLGFSLLRKINSTIAIIDTIKHRGQHLWVILPQHIINTHSINEFKNHVINLNGTDCTCRLCRVFVPQLGFL